MKFPNLANGQEKPFLWEYTKLSKQSIPLQCHTIQLKWFPTASRCTLFLLTNSESASTSTISLTSRLPPPDRGICGVSYSSQGKQAHKLSIEEAITSWSDIATHFSQSNSGRGLQPRSFRLLTMLAALLTQASSAMPNWSGRFSVALSQPREPSDVAP